MIKLVSDNLRHSITKPSSVCRPADVVYNFILTANTEQTVAIPLDTSFIRIKRGNIKKEYAANVYFGFGDTPVTIPTVSGWATNPSYELPTEVVHVDIREVDGTFRIVSDEDVKVQVCFFM